MSAKRWFIVPGGKIKRYSGDGMSRCCLYHGHGWHGHTWERKNRGRQLRHRQKNELRNAVSLNQFDEFSLLKKLVGYGMVRPFCHRRPSRRRKH